MILVDTSVLIDLFKGLYSEPAIRLRYVLSHQIPFGITPVVYQEVLQGAKSTSEFRRLRAYLSTQRFYHPRDPVTSYEAAAGIYFQCRRQGITIRSTTDCLIAQVAMEHQLLLLHHDRDFDAMAPVINLPIYT